MHPRVFDTNFSLCFGLQRWQSNTLYIKTNLWLESWNDYKNPSGTWSCTLPVNFDQPVHPIRVKKSRLEKTLSCRVSLFDYRHFNSHENPLTKKSLFADLNKFFPWKKSRTKKTLELKITAKKISRRWSNKMSSHNSQYFAKSKKSEWISQFQGWHKIFCAFIALKVRWLAIISRSEPKIDPILNNLALINHEK